MPLSLAVDLEKCTGCKICELICSFKKNHAFNPKTSRVQVVTSYPPIIGYPVVCIQCQEAPCIPSCPAKALRRDEATSAIVLDEEKCTGCGLCVKECPYSAISMDEPHKKPLICDLCQGEPECVKWCHFGALKLMRT